MSEITFVKIRRKEERQKGYWNRLCDHWGISTDHVFTVRRPNKSIFNVMGSMQFAKDFYVIEDLTEEDMKKEMMIQSSEPNLFNLVHLFDVPFGGIQ